MELTCVSEVNANTKLKLQLETTCVNSRELKWNVSLWNKRTTSVTLKPNTRRETNVDKQLLTHVLFFCLSASSGTEGIKHVKNFVPFLALYRGFLVPQMPPLWAICTLRVCSDYVVWLPYWESIAVEAVIRYKKDYSYLLVIEGLGVVWKNYTNYRSFYIPIV